MPKTLDDVKAVLTKVEGGDELFEVVNAIALKAASTEKGFNSLQSNYDKILAAAKGIGFDGGDFSSFAGSLKEQLAKASEADSKLTAEQRRLKEIESQLGNVSKLLTEQTAKAASLETERKNALLQDALLAKFRGKIYNAELHAKDLVRDGIVSIGEDGKTINFNGADDLDKGVLQYFEKNKDSLISEQRAGAGGGASKNTLGAKQIQRADFERMTPDAQYKFITDGGKVS
jgi:hypothetical protein